MNTAVSPAAAGSPFWHYVSTRYPLPLHVFYSLVWYLAISGVHAAVNGLRGQWTFGWMDVFGAISATALFFFMRTVDEIKDVEYDRIYKPDRALVQGLVSTSAMASYAAIAGVLLLVSNAMLSWTLALTVLGIMAFSVFLLWFERVVPAFERTTIYFSTAVSVQLKSGAVAYVFLLNEHIHGGDFVFAHWPLVAAFVLAYMHWEMGRKIALPQFIKPGEKSYSSGPGTFLSEVICLAMLVLAVWIVYSAIEPWRPENAFHGLEWLPAAGLLVSAIGMAFVFVKKSRKFPLGPITQASYVLCFLYGIVFQTHQGGTATTVALIAPVLFLFNMKLLAAIQLKVFKGFVNLTAAIARSPFHGFARRLMRKLADINCKMNKGTRQETLPAVAQEWKRMFPIDQNQMPITKVTDDTVYMEIRERCPLRDTGDVGACDRLMEFDRQTLGKLGAQLVVLRSQAEAKGVTVCQIALRKPGADVSDLKSIYSKP